MNSLHFERLTTPSDPRFARAMTLYARSFPPHEQRESASQRAIMAHPAYRFLLVCDGDTFVGLMLCWETDDFVYVEHFCIVAALRNRHYGARALSLLAQGGKRVILEIDPPVDDISRRRRGFYERAGFVANPFPHVHPPYHVDCGGPDLVVMSHPSALSAPDYARFNEFLSQTVMRGATDSAHD